MKKKNSYVDKSQLSPLVFLSLSLSLPPSLSFQAIGEQQSHSSGSSPSPPSPPSPPAQPAQPVQPNRPKASSMDSPTDSNLNMTSLLEMFQSFVASTVDAARTASTRPVRAAILQALTQGGRPSTGRRLCENAGSAFRCCAFPAQGDQSDLSGAHVTAECVSADVGGFHLQERWRTLPTRCAPLPGAPATGRRPCSPQPAQRRG